MNFLYRTLLIESSSLAPYKLQNNSSIVFDKSTLKSRTSPREDTPSTNLYSDTTALKNLILPMPLAELVESHPDNACIPGKAFFTFSSIFAE